MNTTILYLPTPERSVIYLALCDLKSRLECEIREGSDPEGWCAEALVDIKAALDRLTQAQVTTLTPEELAERTQHLTT